MLSDANFIEARLLLRFSTIMTWFVSFLWWNSFLPVYKQVFMNMPLTLCEARDTKGLYKLARAGKIKGVLFNMLTLHFWCIDMLSSSSSKRKESACYLLC